METTMGALGHHAPFLNWTEYFNKAFSQVNISVDEHTEVVVFTPLYLSNLSTIIEEYHQTTEGKM